MYAFLKKRRLHPLRKRFFFISYVLGFLLLACDNKPVGVNHIYPLPLALGGFTNAQVLRIDGTYGPLCVKNAGALWSERMPGYVGPSLNGSLGPIEIAKNDSGCEIRIKGVLLSTHPEPFVSETGVLVQGSYQDTSSSSLPAFSQLNSSDPKLYFNAYRSPADATSDFAMFLLFSSDPVSVTHSIQSRYSTVLLGQVSGGMVPAPNFSADVSLLHVYKTSTETVDSVVGDLQLSLSSGDILSGSVGSSYVIVSSISTASMTPGSASHYEDVLFTYTQALPAGIFPVIPNGSTSYVALIPGQILFPPGLPISSSTERYLIIANQQQGIFSFQILRFLLQ